MEMGICDVTRGLAMEDVLDMNSSGQKDRTSRKVIVEFCGFFFLLQFLLNNNNNNNNNKKKLTLFFLFVCFPKQQQRKLFCKELFVHRQP